MPKSRTAAPPAARRLTQPLVLEDGRPPRVTSVTLYAVSGFVFAAIAWASFTQIREMTVAPGQIAPIGQVHVVNHLEGGIVADLMTREGERIRAGEPLFRLAPASTTSDLGQLAVREAALRLQIIRLDAQAETRVPDFGALGEAHPKLAADQRSLHEAETVLRRRERETLASRLAQRGAEMAAAETAVETSGAQERTAREQLAMQERLLRDGWAARRTFLEARAVHERIRSELAAAEGRLATSREALREAEQALAESVATAMRRTVEERARAFAELEEVRNQIAKHTDRVERLVVRAPSDGIVQELLPRSPGEVIRPGEIVARVVPEQQEVVADVRIDPKDIGHVRIGSPARIRVTTYDATLFGMLEGTVTRISATTLMPQPGDPLAGPNPQPYFRAIVRLSGTTLGEGALRRTVMPGMMVQAEIMTGQRSLVRYMLKPVFTSLDRAFTER